MPEPNQMNEPIYGVVLTDGQQVGITEWKPQDDLFACARSAIHCDMIEIVEPEILAKRNLVLLIDEESKLKNGELFVNCIASYLYKTQEHGDVIVGNAVIVKRNEESLEMLTGLEAVSLAKEMTQQRGHAVETISKALQIPPMPVPRKDSSLVSDIRKKDSHNRQPCKPEQMER